MPSTCAAGDDPSEGAAEADPPFPWRAVLILLLVRLGDGLVSVMLYPMLPFMVAGFGVPPSSVGMWVGVLGTSYNLLQIPANVAWGHASDRFGRRPVMLLGQLSLAAATLALGVSRSLPFAIGARCLSGALHGNLSVAAAAACDVTRPAERARAFSLLGLVFSLAFGLGPLIGALLSRPAAWDPAVRKSPLDTYPYLLPCAAASAVCMCGAVSLAWLELPPRATCSSSSSAQPPSPAPLTPAEDGGGGGGGGGGGAAAGGGGGAAEGCEASPPPPRHTSAPSAEAAGLGAPLLLGASAAPAAPPPPSPGSGRGSAPGLRCSAGMGALCAAHCGYGFLVAGGASPAPSLLPLPSPAAEATAA